MIAVLTSLFHYLSRLPGAMVRAWDRFFFTPTDPIMLGFIRILVGSILFYIHISCVPVVLDFIGPQAWVDEDVYAEIRALPEHDKYKLNAKEPSQSDLDQQAVRRVGMLPFGFSLWYVVTDPFWIKVTYFAGIGCVALFTVGWMTRFTGILSWAFHVSYMHRAMMIWFGMDAMISFMMLYLCISPCGKVLSLDTLLAYRRSRAQWNSQQPLWSATVALRLMQIHMCIVYFIAGIAKLQGSTWWNGIATWITMNSPLFNEGLDISWLTDTRLGEWFWHYFSFITTYVTLAFEICFPFLIWNRYLRPWVLFGAVVLHVGIGLFMGLGGFGAIMLAGCMSFVPASGVRWFLQSIFGQNSNEKLP
ncbi:MAG: HTTM domain-containing protein [Planctomycetia bacterium]|nr:HTTM domain-containing protein [Planctomycetia bacterium]